MDIEIREIEKCDYPEILSLKNEAFGIDSLNEENICERFERMRKNNDYKIFAAVFDDKVIGYITTVQVMAMEYEIGYLKINGLAVKEAYRNKGVGTKLLQYVENNALEKGLSSIILNSGFQRTEAHTFYEHYGFDKKSYCFTRKLK